MISRETAKLESSGTSDNNNNNNSSSKAASTSITTSWSRLKDPRIVRVSRAFGGKDRHSKVCTVRGLRDRRVRLSVPTAIQLYDLQDRLGLNQPSKVVDWLLNAAKAEIDELPPLNFPQSSFLPMLDSINQDHNRSKDNTRENIRVENWGRSLNHIHDFNSQNHNNNPSLLPINASSSSSTSVPFNSFVRWDPSNLTLSHPSKSPNCSSPPPHQQGEDWHNFSLVAAPLPPHHQNQHQHHQHQQHQVLVYQPQPYFQSQISASNAEFDANNVESSTHFNMTANLLPSQNSDGGRS